MNIPIVTTQRLTLRPFTAQDVDPLHRILAEPDALRYFPNSDPPSRERVQRMVSRQLEHWEERGYGWWAVELQAEAGLIGWCGLQYLPETDEVEVAYLLVKSHWGWVWRPKARGPACGTGSRNWGWSASSASCIQRT